MQKPPSQKSPIQLSDTKKRIFLGATLAFPFVLLAGLELSLRAAKYGGDMSAFETPPILNGLYSIPGRNVGKRYFPQEKFPPSPPGDPFLINKPAHSMRIFVLGESSAAGFPYPSNGTFARVLRDALSDILTGDTVEVVNMGMAATNSFTIADLAGDVIDQKPDAVIIYGGHNEYYGALGAGSTESLGSYPSFVRLYLKLQRFKTFLLLRNGTNSVIALFRGGRSTREIEADATRMESVVADQRIVLGDKTYERGVDQYESNLRSAIGRFRSAKIPVFIGSTPSNIRDLRPFGMSIVPPDSGATIVFDSATAVLAAGDSVHAGGMFAHARDLDVVRFRAPGEFQNVVEKVAKETGAIYVPVAEGIAAASRYRIPGSDLLLEHVHPNRRGYVIIARMYFDAMQRQNFLGRRADMSRFAGWDGYTARMKMTDLDSLVASHTIKTVTTRWPFVPVAGQLDYRGTYHPVNLVDSLAFTVSRGGMPWAQAKVILGERYETQREPEKALAEYEGLIRDEPLIEVGWRLAGKALFTANQTARARPYLQRAYDLKPTGFSAFALGVLSMQEKNVPRAVALLENALQLTPDMPPALYQLSLAYAVQRDVGRARAYAARLAQVAPTYPGLGEWMSTLGMRQ
ncbi:MAG: tetratricopeptide repeat protein [Gemmatimonadales bacterium]